MSWKTSTTPLTDPARSRIGAAEKSIATGPAWRLSSTMLPSEPTAISSANARATGSPTGFPVASSSTLNTVGNGIPCASSFAKPVSRSATGLMYSTLPDSVDRDDGVGDRRERHLRALFFLQRLRFRSLAVRNVGERSRHPLRLAPLAQDRAAAQPEPAIAAAGNAQPGLEIERIAAREVFAQRREQLAAVARVHPAQERAGGFAKRARRVAEQATRIAASSTARAVRGSSPRCRRWCR